MERSYTLRREAGILIDACVCLLLPVSQIVVVVNFNIVEQWGTGDPLLDIRWCMQHAEPLVRPAVPTSLFICA